jgi:hypothetical protein
MKTMIFGSERNLTRMSFHKKIVLAFFLFHLVFTVGVLISEYLLAAAGAYDEYGIHFSVVVIFTVILTSALSIALVAVAYLSRFFWLLVLQRQQRAASSQI